MPRHRVSGIWSQIARLGDDSNVWGKIFAKGWALLQGRGGGFVFCMMIAQGWALCLLCTRGSLG